MQIVVKVKPDCLRDAASAIAEKVLRELADLSVEDVRVRKVFPELERGNRARLFMVDLPDSLSEQEVREVAEQLRRQEMLEYAEVPSPRRPL